MARLANLAITLPFMGLLLMACGQTASLTPAASPDQSPQGKAARTEPFAQFKDIPIPGGFGWQEVTSVRAIISVLTYERGPRVATIQILSNKIKGTVVTVTMSPKDG